MDSMKKKYLKKIVLGITVVALSIAVLSIENINVWADEPNIDIGGVGNEAHLNSDIVTAVVTGGADAVIGDNAFSGSSHLTTLDISGFSGTIGSNAFDNCDSLTTFITSDDTPYSFKPGVGLIYTDSNNEKTLIYSNNNMNNEEGKYTVGEDIKYVHDGALNNQYVSEIIFKNSDTQVGNNNSNITLNTVYTPVVDSNVGNYYRGNSKTVEVYNGSTPPTNPPATNPPATNPPATNPPATNPPATTKPTVTPTTPSTPSSGSSDSSGNSGGTYYPSASYSYMPYKEGHIKLYSDGSSGSLESHIFGDWTVSKKSLSGSVASNVTKLSDVSFYVPNNYDVSVKAIAESKASEAKDAAYSLLNISSGSYSVEKVFNVTGKVNFPVDITFYTSAIKAKSKVAVLHQKSDGKWESLPVKDIAAGQVTATFSSFSPAAIVVYSTTASSDTVMTRKCTLCGYEEISVTKQTNYNVGSNGEVSKDHVKDNTPTTADGDISPVLFLVMALCLGGVSVLVYGRRKKYEIIAKNKK